MKNTKCKQIKDFHSFAFAMFNQMKGGEQTMKAKQRNFVLASALAMLFLFGATFVVAQGFGFAQVDNEQKTQMQEAINTGDYETWRSLMESQFSEERFNEMRERQTEMQAHRESVEAAIDSGDYGAWKNAMADAPGRARAMNIVTEENFATFVAMHNARDAGDIETAQTLAEELGLGTGMHEGCPFAKGSGAGFGGKGMGMHSRF